MNASNCHLLWTEDSQGLRLNFIQSVMACLNFQNTYFRQHHQNYWWLLLYVLEALVFQNTSKWMLSSLSNQIIFFSGYFYFKNHPKKHIPSFSLPSMLFIMLSLLLFMLSLFKNFSLLAKHKDFDFFKAALTRLST